MLEEKVDIQLFEEPNELFTLFIIAPIAIVTTFINLYMFATGKVYKLAMAMRSESRSFTTRNVYRKLKKLVKCYWNNYYRKL